MEEANEFLERMAHREEYQWPMFTSCCPGWVRFLKSQYPDMTKQLSTAKSPQQMFGAVAKSYFAEKVLDEDPEKIFCVSIMPCTAKKAECELPNINDAGAGRDVDAVLTTREFDRMLRSELITPANLDEEEFDSPLGTGTGAAVIFGATGGVMEAALRTAYFTLKKENPKPDLFRAVRGLDGVKEVSLEIVGVPLKAAVVHGLGNTRKLMERIAAKEAEYDLVEVMACPGGCAGGGGLQKAGKWPGSAARSCTAWIKRIRCASRTRILRCLRCTTSIWKNRCPIRHTSCCIPTILDGKCHRKQFLPYKSAEISPLQNLSENFSTHLLTWLTIGVIFHTDRQTKFQNRAVRPFQRRQRL